MTVEKLYTEKQVRAILKKRIEEAGSNLEFARQLDVNPAFISSMRIGNKPITGKVLKCLGFETVKKTVRFYRVAK